jgi:hypothetical protein
VAWDSFGLQFKSIARTLGGAVLTVANIEDIATGYRSKSLVLNIYMEEPGIQNQPNGKQIACALSASASHYFLEIELSPLNVCTCIHKIFTIPYNNFVLV